MPPGPKAETHVLLSPVFGSGVDASIASQDLLGTGGVQVRDIRDIAVSLPRSTGQTRLSTKPGVVHFL